ncbi:MAG TPA: 3-oxoacyl-ACP reductase FabG [Actinomycetota bacterium]|nr:3-oxoacyl-ACP reductase FabG [Actinomycetota bacterium]
MSERRVALVTGGSRGIGRAICLKLARSYAIAVNYNSSIEDAKQTVSQIESAGGEAILVQADVRHRSSVETMFEQTEESLGPVTVLVNNAGIRRDGLAVRISDDEWDDVLATNLTGAFSCARRALRSMIRHRFGRIVNISSVAGLRGNPGQANYCAAKAGLIGMTKSLAREVARKNITINAVAPGLVDTELTAALDPVLYADLIRDIPAGRAAAPEEIAAAVSFLCSESAGYVNGAVLVADGAMTA